MMRVFFVFLALGLAFTGCSSKKSSREPNRAQDGWRLVFREDFEGKALPTGSQAWVEDRPATAGRYDDDGAYFKEKNPAFKPPKGFRAAFDFGNGKWLRAESYTRNKTSDLGKFLKLVRDPANPNNKVLRLRSPKHTDASVIRSREKLPPEYKICARVGYADFGTGDLADRKNGYHGEESAGPWIEAPAINENGFYWLAILTEPPQPHNNTRIHHHRKAVIDSDNNTYPGPSGNHAWSNIWNGKKFEMSGKHPVMAFVLDSSGEKLKDRDYEKIGQPFISLSASKWNSEAKEGEIRAVDAYKGSAWYRACIWRRDGRFGLEVEGDFEHGGKTRYAGDIAESRVYKASETPDYFMLGDPHVNFYEGKVYYDDLELYLPEK